MKKNLYILIFVSLLFNFCSGKKQEYTNESPKKSEEKIVGYFYAWVDQVRIRKNPGLKGSAIASLKEGEKVGSLGIISKEQASVTLRGKKINSSFLKVKTQKGVIGWVFKGALVSSKSQIFSEHKVSKEEFEQSVKKVQALLKELRKAPLSNKKADLLKKDFFEKGYASNDNQKKPFKRIKAGKDACTGSFNYYAFYKSGYVVFESELALSSYLIAPFKTRPNGIYSFMSKAQVKAILGKPALESKNALSYTMKFKSIHEDKPTHPNVFYFFFNQEQKLFCIYFQFPSDGC